jgi:hypothetical protein
MRSAPVSFLLVGLFLLAPLAGCFGADDEIGPLSGQLQVTPEVWTGGVFQGVTLVAEADLAAFIPYLIINPSSGYVQNSTVIDLKAGEMLQITLFAPPRTDTAVVMVGEYGRQEWPIRDLNESWRTWIDKDGHDSANGNGILRIAQENSSLDQVINTSQTGGPAGIVKLGIIRPAITTWCEECGEFVADQGGRFATGLVNGMTTYNYLNLLTDESSDVLDLADGAQGYLDRWAGQGNLAYEDGAQWLISEMESFGLEVMTHRFQFTDIFSKQNPEAYNICGYRWGTEFKDEWMVFGAHFDVAPPANTALPIADPHLLGSRTYGTRVGAYDNTAGTSMVLTVAEAMANFDTRRTMVFCLWSGEEGGKRGSDYWTEYYVAEDNPQVTITNYVNLDMAGVNWPGGGGAPHGDPALSIDDTGYPKDDEVWPMRVYIGPSQDYDKLNQPEMVRLAMWIGSDAIGVEQQVQILVGQPEHDEATWKVEDWLDRGRPELIIYEDTTARSDHASFQDNLGTVTMGFGGLVDGYWCYHQVCDTLEEMEDWMDTEGKSYGEENSGKDNLVNSLDMVTWWAAYSFFHLDEKPIINSYL